MSNATKPDALEMLRDLDRTLDWLPQADREVAAIPKKIIAALEAERRENTERDATIREIIQTLRADENYYPNLERILALLDGGAE